MEGYEMKYIEDLKNGIYKFSFVIRGLGRMTGKEFAEHCRKAYDERNKANSFYYELFEKYIINIEMTNGGVINAKLKSIHYENNK